MIDKISRRQAIGILAAPIIVGCRGLELTGPGSGSRASAAGGAANAVDGSRITLIGAGDQHAISGVLRVYREKTAAMVKSVLDADPTAWAFSAGDLTHHGAEAELRDGYDPSWGAFKTRTLFTFGNHDRYTDTTGAIFYDYTGAEKYYARTLGSWRIYVLNCESPDMGGASPNEQTAWLKADLAQHSDRHIMAMWHYPHFSNVCAHAGKEMTWPGKTGPWWQVLQDHGAEFVVSGHVHRWERFAKMVRTGLRTGAASPKGIRQFVTGNGGANMFGVLSRHPNCQNVTLARGVARFDLYSDRYTWKFTDIDGVVRDSGTEMCRKVLGGSEPTPTPGITLSATGRSDTSGRYIDLSWTGAQGDSVDVYMNDRLRKTAANKGHTTIWLPLGDPVTYVLRVCEAGSTSCSNEVSVRI
jgi:predicted phosphodiesterase